MKEVFRSVEQYVVPLILVLSGAAAISFFNSATGLETQPKEMLIGGLALVGSGLLMTPVFNKLIRKRAISIIIGLLLATAAIALGYKVIDVINSENTHRVNREIAVKNTVQRMKDIRLAQEQHRLFKGAFATSLDSLVDFLDEPLIPVPYRAGNVMEDKYFQVNQIKSKERSKFIISSDKMKEMGMTESEALSKHYEVRDTTFVSVGAKYFSKDYRMKRNLPLVDVNELPFNPWSEERFLLEHRRGSEENKKDIYIRVTDLTPYPVDQEDRVKKDTLRFGSLEEISLQGTWSE